MKLSPTAAAATSRPSASHPAPPALASASSRRAPDALSGANPDAASGARLAAPKPSDKIAPKTAPPAREAVIERKPRAARGGDEGAPKKRVRLKPETPEQLLERLRNPQLSLHEASILLRVSRATVRRYADAGRLGCQRTPGGQRRFFLRDIENFYRQLKLKR